MGFNAKNLLKILKTKKQANCGFQCENHGFYYRFRIDVDVKTMVLKTGNIIVLNAKIMA